MEVFGIIYKITFPNNKVYIGQTKRTLEQRKKAHFYHLKIKAKEKEYNYVLYKAFSKYGFDNTIWEIIDYAKNSDELNEKEIYWIKEYRSYIGFSDSNGYNMTLGGESTNKFTTLNEVQLHEFGLECKEGKSDKYLKEKYKLNSTVYRKMINGIRWSVYTKIPIKEWSEDNTNDSLNSFQVCKIIKDFKKHGSAKKLAEELNCKLIVIKKVLMGKTWQNFTGILNESFYYTYTQDDKRKLNTNQVLEIIKMFDKGFDKKYIREKFNLTIVELDNILLGKEYSDITLIKENNKKQTKTDFLTREQVLKIVELLNQEISVNEIAQQMNVTKYVIYNIKNGKTYTDITGIKHVSKEEKIKNGPTTSTYTLEQVLEIVRLHTEEGLTIKEISNKFGYKYNGVFAIINGDSWSNYTGIHKKTPEERINKHKNKKYIK